MKKIGFIGAGHIGSTLARLAIDAGYEVFLSNRRGPASLSQLVTELGPAASAVPPPEAAEADLVVVTVPLHAIDQLPVTDLAGKTVIDTNNYYPDRDGRIPELDSGGIYDLRDVATPAPGVEDRHGFQQRGLPPPPPASVPGYRRANNADDHIDLLTTAYRALPGSDRGGNIGHRILVRSDGAAGTKKFAGYLHARGFAYSLGLRVNGENRHPGAHPAR